VPLPTEQIGSIPRPPELIEAVHAADAGELARDQLAPLYERALRDTIERLEATGSPVITDGEQTKPSFATYPLAGVEALAPDGVEIPFEDGHVRRLPRLTGGPFRYATHADSYLSRALAIARVPVKQAVIAPSALSLVYPAEPIEDYPREAFLDDLVDEAEADVRGCLAAGADKVQLDFTEGRLSVKLDPSKVLLGQFIELNNRVLERFGADERDRIGVHTCPGGDQDSTHSLDVPYAELLPSLFQLKAGNFYIQLASERDRPGVLEVIRDHARPEQRMFIGVIDPIDPEVETPEAVRDRMLEAADYIPTGRLGSTDDCGFAPFGDDTSTPREVAFAKIRARVEGTRMASERLGV
jgi:5-methyltetrahydropteroyltriglutamate--homocysteine methyltransferase